MHAKCAATSCGLNELFDAFAGADGVFAVAALMASSIGQDPWTGIDVNIRGLQNTLEACRYRGVKKIVLSSSAGVYGAPEDVPTDENSPLRWQALASGDLAVLRIQGHRRGARPALPRAPWHRLCRVALYGGIRRAAAPPRAGWRTHRGRCERIRSGGRPILEGDGRQVNDYVYVGDVARANLMAMESAVTGESINICSGVETSQYRIVEMVTEACGSNLEPEIRENPMAAKLPSTARQAYSRDKAKRLLGWEPQVSIEEGVAGCCAGSIGSAPRPLSVAASSLNDWHDHQATRGARRAHHRS